MQGCGHSGHGGHEHYRGRGNQSKSRNRNGNCIYCGRQHKPQEYPVFHKECIKYHRLNCFQNMFRCSKENNSESRSRDQSKSRNHLQNHDKGKGRKINEVQEEEFDDQDGSYTGYLNSGREASQYKNKVSYNVDTDDDGDMSPVRVYQQFLPNVI